MVNSGKAEVLCVVCINEKLSDDELRLILQKLDNDKNKVAFGLVCQRWLHLQRTETRKISFLGRQNGVGCTDAQLARICAGFTCLQILDLRCCYGLTDDGMIAVKSSISSLQSLNVAYCYGLTAKGLAAFVEGQRELRSLDVSSCTNITDDLLQALSKNCHHLEDLGLRCTEITDSGLLVLAAGCPKIKFLDAADIYDIGDVGVSAIAKACPLRSLNLMHCYGVSDTAIHSLAQSCKDLEALQLRYCFEISSKSIISLVMSCTQLKDLDLHSCQNSDSSLTCIFSQCKGLVSLNVAFSEVTDIGFQELGKGGFRSSLEFLNIQYCPRLTVSTIDMLIRTCKSLKCLEVSWCSKITRASCVQAGLVFPEWFDAAFREDVPFMRKEMY